MPTRNVAREPNDKKEEKKKERNQWLVRKAGDFDSNIMVFPQLPIPIWGLSSFPTQVLGFPSFPAMIGGIFLQTKEKVR